MRFYIRSSPVWQRQNATHITILKDTNVGFMGFCVIMDLENCPFSILTPWNMSTWYGYYINTFVSNTSVYNLAMPPEAISAHILY